MAVAFDEPGSEVVQDLLVKAQQDKATVFLSEISILEIMVAFIRSRGEAAAKNDLRLIMEMPIEIKAPTIEEYVAAGLLRVKAKLSTVDAIIATQAITMNAVLFHKDPEFDSVPHLNHQRLPYKK